MRADSKEIVARLRLARLRPTFQRVALARLLFGGVDRHVSAEDLYREAVAANFHVSLATVYNTLNQMTAAGLLRQIAFEGDRSFFDTNTSNHFHYYLEDSDELVDIESHSLTVSGLPTLPKGTEVNRIDVIIRLKSRVSQSV